MNELIDKINELTKAKKWETPEFNNCIGKLYENTDHSFFLNYARKVLRSKGVPESYISFEDLYNLAWHSLLERINNGLIINKQYVISIKVVIKNQGSNYQKKFIKSQDYIKNLKKENEPKYNNLFIPEVKKIINNLNINDNNKLVYNYIIDMITTTDLFKDNEKIYNKLSNDRKFIRILNDSTFSQNFNVNFIKDKKYILFKMINEYCKNNDIDLNEIYNDYR